MCVSLLLWVAVMTRLRPDRSIELMRRYSDPLAILNVENWLSEFVGKSSGCLTATFLDDLTVRLSAGRNSFFSSYENCL